MEFYSKYFEKFKVGVSYSAYSNFLGADEFHVMFVSSPEGNFVTQLTNIKETFFELVSGENFVGTSVVFKRYFLSDAANQSNFLNEIEGQNAGYSVSAVQQPPLNGSKVAVWVYMVKNMQTRKNGKYSVACRNGYHHIWTSQMHGEGLNSYQQTEKIFYSIEDVLHTHNCSLKENCIRTWLFVNNVDINYSGVVEARKKFFSEREMTSQTHYICSTGIEGRNYNPYSFVLADSYSIDGIQNDQVYFLKATDYLNPTYEYGVTFERGTVIQYGDRDHIYISGTASINNVGEILYPNNILRQLSRAFENVEALLAEARSNRNDIAQMIVYLRDISDYAETELFLRINYPQIPKVILLAPVCRPGWLVEVECIAIKRNANPSFRNF